MKLWVDGQCFQTGSNVRGIGRYVIDFLKAISFYDVNIVVSLNGSMKQEAVAARTYINRSIPDAEIQVWYGTATRGELDTAYCSERMVDEKILAGHVLEINPDIALSPSPFEGVVDLSNPFIKTDELEGIYSACIFHDAIPHRYPDVYLQHENMNKLYQRRLAEIPNFDLVLCNSQFTEEEYQDIFEKTNSAAIFAGLSNDIQQHINQWVYDPNSIGAQLGNYVAYVGGMDWRKNVPCLVKAMANLSECRSADLKLVLVGDFGDEYIQPLRKIFEEHNVPEHCLVTTGYVSDKELIDIYKNAQASVQPSRMEGFGLGALEAMACGTPFFSAVGGAVGEVVDNPEQMFDPDVHFSLTQLLQKLQHEEGFRQKVIAHGYQRLDAFTWKKTAAIAMRSFEHLIQSGDKQRHIPALQPATEQAPQRLIMDVTSTALSPVMSGIQRVMHKLSDSAIKQNETESAQTVLSFSQNTKDWYGLPSLDKAAVKLTPQARIDYLANDSYLLLDSSWTFIEGQQQRLSDALVMGQEVVNGIHDIGPLTMSAMTDEGMPPAFRRWFEFVLGYSTGIVCVSRAVADEVYQLIEDIKLPRPMKVGYFRLGADFADAQPEIKELDFVKTRPTFLMVGTIEPRKGQYYGLKAFEKLWAEGVDVNLMIIGKAGWDTKVLQEMLNHHPEKDKRLFWRQGVSDAGLAAAYQQADALIMTSYLEGFGLPVVEAGTKNTPVILSDLPVFREVGEGAPKACYFTPGSVDSLAQTVERFVHEELTQSFENVNVDWPTWEESTKELKDVVLNQNWYKYYEPELTLPNVRFNDIGNVTLDRPLSSDEIAHELRVVEGPFLSDDGGQLRVVIAVKNLSNVLWSSNQGIPSGCDVNLSYHLYDKDGHCISYDNPRTFIPFVLPPGKEILMPIRVSSDWLVKGAYSAGVELVQEGVRWFGNEQRVNLMKPLVSASEVQDTEAQAPLDELQMVYLRGPFGSNLNAEKYFIFSVINSRNSELPYRSEVCEFKYSFIDHDGMNVGTGIWAVNHFDALEANNFGYLALYVDSKHAQNAKYIEIRYEREVWQFELATQTLSKVINHSYLTMNGEPSSLHQNSNKATDYAWLESIDLANHKLRELSIAFDGSDGVSMRGFNNSEGTHIWMSELSGEVDLSSFVEPKTYINELKLTCSPFVKNIEPVELSLYIGKYLVERKILSHDFMEYGFELSKTQFIKLCENNFRITLTVNHGGYESDGERLLSLCVSKLSIQIKDKQNKKKNRIFERFRFNR